MNDTKIKKPIPETKARDLEHIKKPAVSVQVLIFSINKGKLEIVLIERVREPFIGKLSIPGDIISLDESLEDAARRILYEKTGIQDVFLSQLYTFGDLKRDPRGRVIAVTYYALLPHNSVDLSKAPNALHACWVNIASLKDLAFDHKKIIDYAVKRIKVKLEYSTIANAFLPEKFRLYELQRIHEIILEEQLDKRNFRKKMLSMDIIEPTGEMYKSGNHRPAQLYKFKSNQVVNYE